MINASVLTHLEKYFALARSRYEEGDPALATFFALTIIEECGKLLLLRDIAPGDPKERETATDHRRKYTAALINYFTACERYDAWPRTWQDEVWSLLESKDGADWGQKSTWLRNDSLYLHRNRSGRFTTPDQVTNPDRAALLVYLAGQAMGEMVEYIPGVEKDWAEPVIQAAENFRSRFLNK